MDYEGGGWIGGGGEEVWTLTDARGGQEKSKELVGWIALHGKEIVTLQ